MQESWETVLVCQGKSAEDEEESVNGWITLAFALGGVGFDLMCLMEFYKSNKTLNMNEVCSKVVLCFEVQENRFDSAGNELLAQNSNVTC